MNHARDVDCVRAGTVDAHGDCQECGVTAGDPCPACGGVRFHAYGCAAMRGNPSEPPEYEGVALVWRAHAQACKRCAAAKVPAPAGPTPPAFCQVGSALLDCMHILSARRIVRS